MAARRISLSKREAIEGYVFLLPWIIGFLLFSLGPILASVYLSFTRYRGAGMPEWIGIANFQKMFTADHPVSYTHLGMRRT